MTIYRIQGVKEKRNGIYYEYDADAPPLGEGAMGRVYKGYRVDVYTNHRTPVAIKAIHENIPERVVERARREATVAIESPYLLRMYGFIEVVFTSIVQGQTIRLERYFVIMELLDGVTLYDLIQGVYTDRNGKVIPAIKHLHDAYITDKYNTIRGIIVKVLRGVLALHNANYIHRDIDPSNIMITSDGHVKLIDFGICKLMASLGPTDKNLTSTGMFMGKVHYAAPELVIGDVLHQGPATDIYALGVLLFQLCTGHLPFSGVDNDVMLAHMRKPMPLGEVEKRSCRKIIDRATKKAQTHRYKDAAKMLEDLENIDFKSGVANSLITIFLIVVSIVVTICVVIKLWPSSVESDRQDASDVLPKDTVCNEVIIEEHDTVFLKIQKRLWSQDDKEVYDAFQELARMAKAYNDNPHVDAMFEYGLTFSVGNEVIDIPTQRQRILHIDPDIERANLWLRRTYDMDSHNYRAVYWILNNMIAKKKLDNSSVLADEISDLFHRFNEMTEGINDEVSQKYKLAVDIHRPLLKQWNI